MAKRMQRLFLLGKDVLIGCPQKKVCDFEDVALEKVAVDIMTIQGLSC